MDNEKCCCHIVLADGTRVAIKDDQARAMAMNIYNAVQNDLARIDVLENEFEVNKTYAQSIEERVNVVNKDLQSEIEIRESKFEEVETEIAQLKDTIKSTGMQYLLIPFKNSITGVGASNAKFRDVRLSTSLKPAYIDIGVCLSGDSSDSHIIRVPYIFSSPSEYGYRIEHIKLTSLYCYIDADYDGVAVLNVKIENMPMYDGTYKIRVHLTLLEEGTKFVSTVRIQNIAMYFLDYNYEE